MDNFNTQEKKIKQLRKFIKKNMHLPEQGSKQWLDDRKFNIGGRCELQNIVLSKKVMDILEKPYDLLEPSFEDHIINSFRPGQDQRYGTDFSKITKYIGWQPYSDFEKELELTVHWYLDRLGK